MAEAAKVDGAVAFWIVRGRWKRVEWSVGVWVLVGGGRVVSCGGGFGGGGGNLGGEGGRRIPGREGTKAGKGKPRSQWRSGGRWSGG